MENIEITTEISAILDTNLGVVLEESASSLTRGLVGTGKEGFCVGFRY
ncbi:hypothetical protein [Candidatus Odyssella thessalonicensis]|nr:hypothetical protein [Candidatus Odyssella thessalonicensis]